RSELLREERPVLVRQARGPFDLDQARLLGAREGGRPRGDEQGVASHAVPRAVRRHVAAARPGGGRGPRRLQPARRRDRRVRKGAPPLERRQLLRTGKRLGISEGGAGGTAAERRCGTRMTGSAEQTQPLFATVDRIVTVVPVPGRRRARMGRVGSMPTDRRKRRSLTLIWNGAPSPSSAAAGSAPRRIEGSDAEARRPRRSKATVASRTR